MIWREEFQRRGVVHFHLLVFWRREPNTVQLRRWVARTWNEVAEPGDEKHAKAGTSCDRVRIEDRAGAQRLTRYLLKYLAKREQDELIDPNTGEKLPTGRMWGQWGRVPQATVATIELDEHDTVQLYRRIRKWGKRSPYLRAFGTHLTSGVILGDSTAIVQLVRGLGTPATQPDRAPP